MIDTEDNRFCETVSLLHKFGEMTSNRFCSSSQGYDALEIPSGIFVIRNGSTITINLVLARPPPGGIPFGNDSMNAVGREESVFDSLSKTVLVNWIAEIEVSIPAFLPKGRRRHSELNSWLKIFENHAPCAVIAGATAMAFIDNHKIKKIRRIRFEKTDTAFVLSQSLINSKIHLPAFYDFARFDFVSRVAEGREDTVLGWSPPAPDGLLALAAALAAGASWFQRNLRSSMSLSRCGRRDRP